MSYTDHFHLVDDVSSHFDGVLSGLDPLLKSRYAGFYAVTSAAVLELALKEIVIAFAQTKHPLFGEYVASKYERINGRIGLDDCHKEHLKPFGENFRAVFKARMTNVERHFLVKKGVSIKSSYANLLTCRHSFAHEGAVPATATYEEVKQGFEAGKIVMMCLSRTLS
jgi:hypothetical protein